MIAHTQVHAPWRDVSDVDEGLFGEVCGRTLLNQRDDQPCLHHLHGISLVPLPAIRGPPRGPRPSSTAAGFSTLVCHWSLNSRASETVSPVPNEFLKT